MTLDFSEVPAVYLDTVTALLRRVADRAPVVLMGPPGIGRTMIARRVPGLMPPDDHAQRWIAAEHEVLMGQRLREPIEAPFRAPHYTVSAAAMTGGRFGRPGIPPRAGECELARWGVLYLDELPEFPTATLRDTGQKLRSMRAGRPYVIASAQPCPCGWHGYTARACSCSEASIAYWRTRVASSMAMVGIEQTITIPEVPRILDAMRGTERCPSTEQLAAIMQ